MEKTLEELRADYLADLEKKRARLETLEATYADFCQKNMGKDAVDVDALFQKKERTLASRIDALRVRLAQIDAAQLRRETLFRERNKKERNARTHRLCVWGGLVEAIFGENISDEAVRKILLDARRRMEERRPSPSF